MTKTQWLNALPKPVAFVLSGGASLGAIQAGMLKALHAAKLYPDLIVGTSAGALNGVAIANYGLDEGIHVLEDLWMRLTREDIFPGGRISQMRQLLSTRISLFPNHRLTDLICSILSVTQFEELQLPFAALATELLTFHGALFNSGNLRPALLASTSIPGIYPPVNINGVMYVDGALTAHVPLAPALKMGAASLVILDAGEICHRQEMPRHIAEMFTSTLQVAMRQRVRVEAPAIAKDVPILYLPTPCPITDATLNFSQSHLLMTQAEEMATAFLATAPLPTAGKMSGAPHFHEDEPMHQHTKFVHVE